MFELAKLEKQAELQQNSNGNADLNSSRSSTSSREPNRIPTPKMPHFDEKEDLDAYLLRFERFATAQEWPEEQWALNLSLCLKGESLRVYSRLPPDDSQDYQKLKKALLKRFQFTEEGFRQKFRRERPKKEKHQFNTWQGWKIIWPDGWKWAELTKRSRNFQISCCGSSS
ncbi:reverse transcriptase [Apostichopus japonicus]|uniref:Reverse transcriptase n=1 Tax=Stichopus japonicus TaxID=307972 RepID=A0A2G8LA33_STIJA|nr:reverse transcriptase [Apostichopus japonicus]